MKMTAKWLCGALAATMLVLSGVAASAAEDRIVYVNLEKVFSEFYKTKLADQQLKDQAEEFKAERKKLIDDFQALQATFNKARDEAQDTALAEDVRNQKRSEAEEKLVEIREQESKIRRFDESRQKQLDEQSRRMRKRIVDEIKENLATYARTQGYTAVMDYSGESLNGVNVILYTDAKSDITEALIGLLNKGISKSVEKAK